MRSMTLEKALEILHSHEGVPPALLEFARAWSGHHSTQAVQGASGLQSALGMLNRLVAEAEQKKDLECRECSNYQEKQWWIWEEARLDFSVEEADTAAAHRDILAAETELEELKGRVSDTQDMIDVLGRKCEQDAGALRGELDVMLEDIQFMERTKDDQWCQSQRLFLLHRCSRRPMRRRGGNSLLLLSADTKRRGRTKQGWSSTRSTRRCSLKRDSTCDHIRDEFFRLQSETLEERDFLRGELHEASTLCDDARHNYYDQIVHLEAESTRAQTRLATSMAMQNEADEHLHIKASELRLLEGQHDSITHECFQKVESIEHKICGLRTIRDAMQKMQKQDAYILDCQVSKWVREECSATCGGGTQKISRSILVHPIRGAACPPLEGVQPCAEEPCPVHCELEDWGGWSGCSANCGGGVRERVRRVHVKPRHGGQPCGATVETQPCGVDSCDADCALAPWGPWSACSRDCGSGLKSRSRPVQRPALGAGSCPSSRSEMRLQYLACNTQACANNAGASSQGCQRKLDVVLLLDSGEGQSAPGFNDVKQAAASLARSLGGGSGNVQMAVQLFGGPRSLTTFSACTGSAGPPANFASECGIQWVSHFTPDLSTLEGTISQLGPTGGSPLTSVALALAQDELTLGRHDAERVVVVITNRKPVSPVRTQQAAMKLQREARLMWIPVSKQAPVEYIKKLASRPVRDNLLFVKDFSLLSMSSTVATIVGSICPP